MHRSGRTARAAATGLSVALIEPADVKAHQRLCRELNKADGLPELPIESHQLPRVREIVSLGRQLERAAHMESRKASNARWRKQLAKDMVRTNHGTCMGSILKHIWQLSANLDHPWSTRLAGSTVGLR